MIPFSDSKNREGLLNIFQCDNKNDLKKHCKSLTIYMDDFVDLIDLCESVNIGLKHRIYQRDIIPPELVLEKNGIENVVNKSSSEENNRAKKLSKNEFQFFRVRRYLVAHVFYLPPGTKYWHFFYFDQRDIVENKNHWQYGSHIHFINYLWPEYTAKGIWQQFMTDKPKIKSALHIRWLGNMK